ncbi:Calx-beta domain-containing protein [Limimaricola hongkongensis]|uniref:Hemolysin-type calcium-binding region n=1 Tax=Limimaricola hongkongensis DSM 17492 TaxID=1122180 RepID=A0A017HGI0_9RHOB|nr:Calx-beta domain-containing protein [Limimaricola hongkongensis]EYD73273.1 Hemolysin-type calcium-binding region [Limimaricola hongkongensis DSM 17492]
MSVISVSGTSLAEGQSSYQALIFNLTLDRISTDTITVPWQITGGSVTGKTDLFSGGSYSSGVVTFRPGETLKEVRAYPFGDALVESDESVVIELLTPSRATLEDGAASLRAVGWVLDDDGLAMPRAISVSDPRMNETGTAEFELSLSRPAMSELRIPYSFGGSARAGEDHAGKAGTLVIAPGETEARIRVPLKGDRVLESLETIELQLDLPDGISQADGGRALLIDDDAGSGPYVLARGGSLTEGDSSYNTLTYLVSLTEPSSETVTVGWRLAAGLAQPGTDHFSGGSYSAGTLTFRPGEMVKQVSVFPYGDLDPETDESVVLELLEPTGALLPGRATVTQAVGWVLDNDSAGNTLALHVSDPTVLEHDDARVTASFEMELSRPAPFDIDISYRTRGDGATAGRDFVQTSGTVTIHEGQRTATVGVEVIGDNGYEADEDFSLGLFVPGVIEAYSGGRATILNDDALTDVLRLSGTGGNDRISGEAYNDRIEGRGGNDRLLGLAGDDTLLGQKGNDVLLGGGGDDTLLGASGGDVLTGQGGRDTLKGGGGDDVLNGQAGVDILKGGGGNDRLTGGNRGDLLDGQGGRDTLIGGGGGDVLTGGKGNDRLTGNAGRDIFVFHKGSGTDAVTDFRVNIDLIEIQSGANGFRKLDLSQAGDDTIIAFGDQSIRLLDVAQKRIDADDFLFT